MDYDDYAALIQDLERHITSAESHLETNPNQTSYWRGVMFGLDLALLEVRKAQPPAEPSRVIPDGFYDTLNQFVYDHLDNLISLCQAGIKRDLLVYNAKKARYELLRFIRQQAGHTEVSEYEQQADPDRI